MDIDVGYNTFKEADQGDGEKVEMINKGHDKMSETTDLAAFIGLKFKKRECDTFIASTNNPELCGCSRPRDVHHNISDQVGTWNKDLHTSTSKTNAFGEIKFLGFGQSESKLKPYIRLDHKTNFDDVWILLKDFWQVEPPTLIISVTGGNKSFYLSRKMEHAFRHGLVNAASSTGAWITTTGHNAGVAQVVGQAVEEYGVANVANKQITCLGCLSWGYVDNKEALVNEKGRGLFPAVYNFEDCQPTTNLKNEAPLQPNHTHFLFIDDGVDKKYGGAEFRAGIEMHIAQKVSAVGEKCPVVRLVLEGGVNTLEGAAEAIKNNIPCVFFKGTGRTADFIAHAFMVTAAYSSDEHTVFPHNFNDLIEKETINFLKQCKIERPKEKIYANVKTILSKRLLVNVFDFSSGDKADVEFAILNALLKANRSDINTQASLALAWNRCDLARKEIFAAEKRQQWLTIPLQDHMTKALVQNKVEFVHLFLDKGVDIRVLLTDSKLAELWALSLDTPSNPIATLIKTRLRMTYPRLHGKFDTIEKSKTNEFLSDVGEMLADRLGFRCLNPYSGGALNVFEKFQSKDGQRRFIDPEKELFMWAICFNRPELAVLFWQTGNDQIALALSGASILLSFSELAYALDMTDLAADLEDHAKELEEKACGVLNECDNQDRLSTRQTLARTLPQFGYNVTPMSISNVGKHMRFMENSACQSFLSQVWKGNLATYTESWRILLATIIPFIILTMRFRQEPQNTKTNTGCPQEAERIYSPITKDSPIGVFRAGVYFYTSPMVKFINYTISMIVLFGVFAYFVTINLRPWNSDNRHHYSHTMEIIVWVWMFSLVAEEVRQVVGNQAQSWKGRISDWIGDFWNQLDLVIYILLLLSIILRFALSGEAFFYARVTYVACLSIMLIRFTNNMYVHPDLGPKVIMIGKMLNDLMFFLALLLIFIFSYGICSQALLFPNAIPQLKMLKTIFYYPYWTMNGQFDLDLAEGHLPDGSYCSKNSTILANNPGIQPCPNPTWVVPLALCIYVLIVNVLLLNLLIAIFSYTFQQIQEQSNRVWRYSLYAFIEENYNRPVLAPPLVIFSHIFYLGREIYRKSHGIKRKSDFYVRISALETARLRTFERYAANVYNFRTRKEEDEKIVSQIESNGQKLSKVAQEMRQITEDFGSKTGQSRDNDTIESLQATVNELRSEVSGQQACIDQQTQLLKDILTKLNTGVDPK